MLFGLLLVITVNMIAVGMVMYGMVPERDLVQKFKNIWFTVTFYILWFLGVMFLTTVIYWIIKEVMFRHRRRRVHILAVRLAGRTNITLEDNHIELVHR